MDNLSQNLSKASNNNLPTPQLKLSTSPRAASTKQVELTQLAADRLRHFAKRY